MAWARTQRQVCSCACPCVYVCVRACAAYVCACVYCCSEFSSSPHTDERNISCRPAIECVQTNDLACPQYAVPVQTVCTRTHGVTPQRAPRPCSTHLCAPAASCRASETQRYDREQCGVLFSPVRAFGPIAACRFSAMHALPGPSRPSPSTHWPTSDAKSSKTNHLQDCTDI